MPQTRSRTGVAPAAPVLDDQEEELLIHDVLAKWRKVVRENQRERQRERSAEIFDSTAELFFKVVLLAGLLIYVSVLASNTGVYYMIEWDAWWRCWLISTPLPDRGWMWSIAEWAITSFITSPTFWISSFHGNQVAPFRAMHSMGPVTPFAGGVAVYSHDAVSASLLNMTEDGKQYLNGYPVSKQCKAYIRIMESNHSNRHHELRKIYSASLQRFDLSAQNHSLLPEPTRLVGSDGRVISAELVDIQRSVARNVWFRVFLKRPSESLEQELARFCQFADKCRLGSIIRFQQGNIEELHINAVEAASQTQVGMDIMATAKNDALLQTEETEVLRALIDDILHVTFSAAHLAVSALDRIQSDPAHYSRLWKTNPRAFLIENARLDPAIASTTTVLSEDQQYTVSTGNFNESQPVNFSAGSTVQLVISEANTDPVVFGGPGQSVARSRDFYTNRNHEEIANVLSWNGFLVPKGNLGNKVENATSVAVRFNGTLSSLTLDQQATLQIQGTESVVNSLRGVSLNDVMHTTLQNGSVILQVIFFPFRVKESAVTEAAEAIQATPLLLDLGGGTMVSGWSVRASTVEVFFDSNRSGHELHNLTHRVSQEITDRFEMTDFDKIDMAKHTQDSRTLNRMSQQPATDFLNKEVALGLWGLSCVLTIIYVMSYCHFCVTYFRVSTRDYVNCVYIWCLLVQIVWAWAIFTDWDVLAEHCIVQVGATWYMSGVILAQYRWDNFAAEVPVDQLGLLVPPRFLFRLVVCCTLGTHVVVGFLQNSQHALYAKHDDADWLDDVSNLGLESWLARHSAPGSFKFFVAHLLSGSVATKVATIFCIPAMFLAYTSLAYFCDTEPANQPDNAKWYMAMGGLYSVIAGLAVALPQLILSYEFWPVARSVADIVFATPWVTMAVVCVNERVRLGPNRAQRKNSFLYRSAKLVICAILGFLAIYAFVYVQGLLYSSKICIDADDAVHTDICKEGDAYLRAVDSHTRIAYQLVHNFANTRGTRDHVPFAVRPPVDHYGRRNMVTLPCNIDVPSWDEDFPDSDRFKMALFDFLRWELFHPFDDPNNWLVSSSRAADVLDVAVGKDLEPLELTRYQSLSTDSDLERFTFSGLAAHTVQRVAPADAPGVVYKSNFSWMSVLDVRPKFEKYGATAYFDRNAKLLKIFWDHGNIDVFPDDVQSLWAHAKWAFKCSVLVGVTVKDHLAGIHFMASNFLSTSAVRNLNPDHSIRRMLKPHTFGAASINKAATLTLVSENSFVHRATALTKQAMKDALNLSVHSIEYLTTDEHLARTQMANVSSKLYPWGHDLVNFTAVVKRFVKAYVEVYYTDDKDIRDDTELAEFWRDLWLDPTSPIAKCELNRDRVVSTLTHFIVYVTGIHNHVGNVADYLRDPHFVSAKIRKGWEVADTQALFQILNIGLTTTRKVPRLLTDFTHVLLQDEHLYKTSKIFRQFQKDLMALSADIEARNTERGERNHPCNSFNPDTMVSSVSI